MEVFCPILEFREEKWTFAKVERGNLDFFLLVKPKLLPQSSFAPSGHSHCQPHGPQFPTMRPVLGFRNPQIPIRIVSGLGIALRRRRRPRPSPVSSKPPFASPLLHFPPRIPSHLHLAWSLLFTQIALGGRHGGLLPEERRRGARPP